MSSDGDPAAEAFGLLSDPIRVDVLRAIARAQHEKSGEGVARLSFSEIYDRVAVDNTSKLSYHLGELTGTFVRKDDSGYSFTHAGEHVVRFILARNFEDPRDVGVNETTGTCLFCGAEALAGRINHQLFLVECGACGRPNVAHDVTAAQARERDWPALAESLAHRQAAEFAQVQRGHCPMCDGLIRTTVREAPETGVPESVGYLALSECQECLRCYNSPLPYTVVHHPASVAFHWDHGLEVTELPLWEFHERVVDGDWTAERDATDPPAYQVVLRSGTDELRATLDATATVIATERVRR